MSVFARIPELREQEDDVEEAPSPFIRYSRPEYCRAVALTQGNILQVMKELSTADNSNNNYSYIWSIETNEDGEMLLARRSGSGSYPTTFAIGNTITDKGNRVSLNGWEPVDEEVSDE